MTMRDGFTAALLYAMLSSAYAADGELDIRVWFFAAASLSYPSPTVILGGAKNLRGGG